MPGCRTSRTFFAETETWMAAASVTEYGDPVTDARSAARAVAARTNGPGAWRRPCWCTVSRTPTCRSASRSGRTPRCGPPAVTHRDRCCCPGEGHTIVGHDGRLASTRRSSTGTPGGLLMTGPPALPDRAGRVPARAARRGRRSGRAGATRLRRHRRRAGRRRHRRAAGGGRARLDQVRKAEGITFIADIDGELQEQPFPLDPDPPGAVGRGLGGDRRRVAATDQGAERLPRRRLRRRPRSSGTASSRQSVIHNCPGFLPAARDLAPGGRPRATVLGFDLLHAPSGRWVVLEDNLRVPSGLGYAVSNRRTAAAALPMLHPWPGSALAGIGRRGAAVGAAAVGAAALPRVPPRRSRCSPTVRRTPPGTSTGCWPMRWASRW